MNVDYNHSENHHTLTGPQAALPFLFAKEKPSSLLDVGCGMGTWLKAAIDIGIADVFGVDGVEISPDKLLFPSKRFRQQDLSRPWNLNKRFDAAICLEVAEHLDAAYAPTLIDALVQHSDWIIFSAACPGQEGQHHVNCQWPAYWQQLFNQRGYICSDDIRWRMWDDEHIEPWYRQNIFVARRDSSAAGREPRIKTVLHPEMLPSILSSNDRFESHVKQIEQGSMSVMWYLKTLLTALSTKSKRRLS
jgi:SAM-dependent methyltransferase